MFRKGDALSCVHNVVTSGLMGGHSLVVKACGLNSYIKKMLLYSFLNLGNIAEFMILSFNEFHLFMSERERTVFISNSTSSITLQTCMVQNTKYRFLQTRRHVNVHA